MHFTPFPLELNLNINKNCSTLSVGSFFEVDVSSQICSEPPSPFPEVGNFCTRANLYHVEFERKFVKRSFPHLPLKFRNPLWYQECLCIERGTCTARVIIVWLRYPNQWINTHAARGLLHVPGMVDEELCLIIDPTHD